MKIQCLMSGVVGYMNYKRMFTMLCVNQISREILMLEQIG